MKALNSLLISWRKIWTSRCGDDFFSLLNFNKIWNFLKIINSFCWGWTSKGWSVDKAGYALCVPCVITSRVPVRSFGDRWHLELSWKLYNNLICVEKYRAVDLCPIYEFFDIIFRKCSVVMTITIVYFIMPLLLTNIRTGSNIFIYNL